MGLDIEALRLTDEEMWDNNTGMGHALPQALADAQLAKAIDGIAVWLENDAPHTSWVAGSELISFAREANIERPGAGKAS